MLTDSILLGELAATGRLCPCTGWWECVDEGHVQGGRRQWFERGQQLPTAVLLGRPTLWQRLFGKRPSFETVTVWTLVEYDDHDTVPMEFVAGAEA